MNPWRQYAKWNKPVTKWHIWFHLYEVCRTVKFMMVFRDWGWEEIRSYWLMSILSLGWWKSSGDRSGDGYTTLWMCLMSLNCDIQLSSVQSLSRVQLSATPWIVAHQASLSMTNSWSSLRLTSIESVMPSSHLILCRPLLLLPLLPPSIRVFSNESTLHVRWP